MRGMFLVTALILLSVTSGNSQIAVRLKVDERTPAFSGQTLFCDKKFNCGLKLDEESKTGAIGEQIAIQVWRNDNDFLVAADTDRDGKLADEKKIFLRSGSHIEIRISKKFSGGKSYLLPYKIEHERETVRGVLVDSFSASAQFIVTGTLAYKTCTVRIGLSDMDRNGRFELLDAHGGTNLGIDRNSDGKFWGLGEYRRTNEIIDFCGRNFLIRSLNNSQIIFAPTTLQLAKIGETVPDFAFRLIDGQNVTAKGLRGKPFVLDFWASWCVPCVEKLSLVKQLEAEHAGRVNVYSINVDEPSQKQLAAKIIAEKALREFSVIRGLGDKDPFWKTFGGANLNSLSIPLYVLIDRDGIVRYAANGGDELKRLKDAIEKLPIN